jgi:DNA-binding response OmpR family regulator
MQIAPRVLVTDDDDQVRVIVVTILRRSGFRAESARDGKEAIAMMALANYDAVLLDLMMPRIDGFDVIEHLSSQGSDFAKRKVIVLTAASQSNIAKLNESDVFRVMRKPFEMDDLLAAVRECTGHRAPP